MKYLIVNADDLGLTKSVNRGVIEAYAKGIVTDISILAAGSEFADAARAAKTAGIQNIGAHFSLTRFLPIAGASDIPGLVDTNGRFYRDRAAFFIRYFAGKIPKESIHLELKRQAERVIAAGFTVTNLNSHEHIHMMPGMLQIFIRVAREFNIPVIRCLTPEPLGGPISFGKLYRIAIAGILEGLAQKAIRKAGLIMPNRMFGFLDSGHLNGGIVERMLKGIPDGVTELVTHPGYVGSEIEKGHRFHENCERELAALIDPKIKKLCSELGIKLISHKDLPDIVRRSS
ncbi:MAG: ChbG/HpnK family deacetylase [Candidatus Omnitrophota bacterium]